MVRSAAALITTRGVSAMTFVDVTALSGVARGSIYHYFPGGKKQLVGDAIRWTSGRTLASIDASSADNPADVLRHFIDFWRQSIEESDGIDGCVVASAMIDSCGRDPEVREIARDTFRSWILLLSARLRVVGVPAERARSIARVALASVEGALILCRVEGNCGPLDDVSAALIGLVPSS
jgi:TetR/AcrR family transcriptional regulator, lmrAB and yxaGH operons repressor